MQIIKGHYQIPPRSANDAGQPRKVGVEVEFGGIPSADAAAIVQCTLGGKTIKESGHRYSVQNSALGTVKLELDAAFVHPEKTQAPDEVVSKAKAVLGNLVQPVVPCELVTEPLEFHQLALLDPVIRHLRAGGAKGTSASIAYAFGLHFNPMVASYDPRYLLAILKAFVIKNTELRARIRPDKARTLLGWAEPYHPDYAELILSPDYSPDLEDLIRDYVSANPGRNHDLDMLPLFAFLNETLVTEKLGRLTFSPRPAFHYRLPDSLIDQASWTPAEDWNRWVEVERLAADMFEDETLGERPEAV